MRLGMILAGVVFLCVMGTLSAMRIPGPAAAWLSQTGALVVGGLVFVSCFTGMMVAHLSMAHERAVRDAADLAHANAELERLIGLRTQSLSEKVIELECARAEAVEANTAKSRFLATMSHELRTPLNAILGFSELIRRESYGPVGDGRYVDYAQYIFQSGSHLLSLIGDILDLSKIEAGKMELRCVPLAVAEIAGEVLPLLGGRAVAVAVDDGLPLLLADRRALAQMVLNLLSNAVKFTPPRGTIAVTASLRDDGGIAIAVRDTGIGIAKQDMAKALAAYGQVTNAEIRKHAGTGLGLPIVNALMGLHGGTLELESELGRGTCATLNFPPERSLRGDRSAAAA